MYPEWFNDLLGAPCPSEGRTVDIWGRRLIMQGNILRDLSITTDAHQRQTSNAFAFKWLREDSYNSPSFATLNRDRLIQRYGDLSEPGAWRRFPGTPIVLDAGCGAGLSARLLFGDMLKKLRYVGIDISSAIDIAAATFSNEKVPGVFMQADLCHLPLRPGVFDFILSEGVLHHTPSTRTAFHALVRHLKPGGVFAFYVYAKKAPVREFTDDFIRAKLAHMTPQEAWQALMPLTKLGMVLGKANATIEVPEDIELLEIPKGKIDVQRLIYWYICKMYYRPEWSPEENNHVNFDWFSPAYSHRQTPEEVQGWCEEAGLKIEAMRVEEAGITTIATFPC